MKAPRPSFFSTNNSHESFDLNRSWLNRDACFAIMIQPEWVRGLLLARRRHIFFWVRVAVGTTVALILLFTVWPYGLNALSYLHNENARDHGTKPTTGQEIIQEISFEQGLGNARSPIPHKIWQIILPKKSSKNKPIDPEQLPDTLSWIAMNPDYA